MHVYSTKDGLLGSIKLQSNPFSPTFFVLDSNKRVLLEIQGPFLPSACCNDVTFNIFAKGGTKKLGFISKNWTGAFREIFTGIDNFTVAFPLDLDVKVKAVLLGALILIAAGLDPGLWSDYPAPFNRGGAGMATGIMPEPYPHVS
ncbi:phospholipid scramblase 3-like [Haemaphysalis longicornis]